MHPQSSDRPIVRHRALGSCYFAPFRSLLFFSASLASSPPTPSTNTRSDTLAFEWMRAMPSASVLLTSRAWWFDGQSWSVEILYLFHFGRVPQVSAVAALVVN